MCCPHRQRCRVTSDIRLCSLTCNTQHVQGVLQRLSKKLGVDLRVARFVRLQCGEGLEDDRKPDFAAEVASMAA